MFVCVMNSCVIQKFLIHTMIHNHCLLNDTVLLLGKFNSISTLVSQVAMATTKKTFNSSKCEMILGNFLPSSFFLFPPFLFNIHLCIIYVVHWRISTVISQQNISTAIFSISDAFTSHCLHTVCYTIYKNITLKCL